MKRIFALVLALLLLCAAVAPVYASDGNVVYNGNARKFIFAPGSPYSPTDLFPEFKGAMPGDSLVQRIEVKSAASDVTVYLRALGAHKDSAAFLSQLRLRVEMLEDGGATNLFDAAADKTAQLTDWICLGTVRSGGEVELDVILDIPVELDNQYSDQIGYLDWEFRVDELPAESPETGDTAQPALWGVTLMFSAGAISLLVSCKKRKRA